MNTITYDITWENPSAAQQAAREHAIRWGQAFIRGHRSNETALAEVILFAPESLWFAQVKSWLQGQDPARAQIKRSGWAP